MSIKYTNPEWGKLIVQELESRGMSQKELAKRMGKTGAAVRMLLKRETITLANVRALSKGMGRDYVELLLSEESKTTLDMVRLTGFHPGAQAIQDQVELEIGKVRQEKFEAENREQALKIQLDALMREFEAEKAKVRELGASIKTQKKEIKSLKENNAEIEKLMESHQAELSKKDKFIGKLRTEKREIEFDTKLKISVLEAKLEVLQPG